MRSSFVQQILIIWVLLFSPGSVLAGEYEVAVGKLGLVDGEYVVRDETQLVPRCVATEINFGFTVRRNPPGRFRAHAEYILPAAPAVLSKNLRDESPTNYAKGISGDERLLETFGVWRIRFDEDDPPGSYAVRVFVDQVLIQVVEFKLVACP